MAHRAETLDSEGRVLLLYDGANGGDESLQRGGSPEIERPVLNGTGLCGWQINPPLGFAVAQIDVLNFPGDAHDRHIGDFLTAKADFVADGVPVRCKLLRAKGWRDFRIF